MMAQDAPYQLRLSFMPMVIKDIIRKWPTVTEFAADVGRSRNTVAKWWERDSIRPEHWPDVVEAAKRRGFDGVTLETLARASVESAAAKHARDHDRESAHEFDHAA